MIYYIQQYISIFQSTINLTSLISVRSADIKDVKFTDDQEKIIQEVLDLFSKPDDIFSKILKHQKLDVVWYRRSRTFGSYDQVINKYKSTEITKEIFDMVVDGMNLNQEFKEYLEIYNQYKKDQQSKEDIYFYLIHLMKFYDPKLLYKFTTSITLIKIINHIILVSNLLKDINKMEIIDLNTTNGTTLYKIKNINDLFSFMGDKQFKEIKEYLPIQGGTINDLFPFMDTDQILKIKDYLTIHNIMVKKQANIEKINDIINDELLLDIYKREHIRNIVNIIIENLTDISSFNTNIGEILDLLQNETYKQLFNNDNKEVIQEINTKLISLIQSTLETNDLNNTVKIIIDKKYESFFTIDTICKII